jgi:hypothetical protein
MSTLSSLPGTPEPSDDTKPSSGGENPGEALSKLDFSHVDPVPHTDLGSQGADHSDVHAALASMSSEDALEYAISHIGLADHLDAGHSDAGHFDMPLDTPHHT